MLVSNERLVGCSVLSLHVGGTIAKTVSPIIDPNELKVVAFFVDGAVVRGEEAGNILETKSIREFSSLGMIVDSADEFVNEGDVIRLDEIIALDFKLIGLLVETKRGTKLGKVVGFTMNVDNFMIQQIVVKRPFMKSFNDPELLIGRSEVVEISDYKITVKDEESKIRKNAMTKDFVPDFVNPFREQQLATADNRIPDVPDKQ